VSGSEIVQSLIFFGCLFVAVILHEVSHGVVANWFGDSTAKRAGRITLNPIPHVDPLGSIILPAVGAFTGIPVIGWAKPVPVNPRLLRNPRSQMLLVSLAGPFTNFLLAAVSAVTARALFDEHAFYATFTDVPIVVRILISFTLVNVGLGVFNLLPIPPLDGASIIERFLPDRALASYHRFRPYGMLVLLGLVWFTGILDRLLTPFYDAAAEFILR